MSTLVHVVNARTLLVSPTIPAVLELSSGSRALVFIPSNLLSRGGRDFSGCRSPPMTVLNQEFNLGFLSQRSNCVGTVPEF